MTPNPLAAPTTQLTWFERAAAAILGLAMYVGSVCFTYAPPHLPQLLPDCSPTETVECVATVAIPQDGLPLANLGVGTLLFAFALNGRKLSSLKMGEAEANFSEAAKELAEGVPDGEPSGASTAGDVAPAGTLPASGANTTTVHSKEMAIIGAADVPVQVLQDFLAKVKDLGEQAVPKSLSEIEYAARRTGRGNHPWIFKVKGCELISLSYGGQGKPDPTIAWTNQSAKK